VQAVKRKKTFVLVVPRFEDILHAYYAGEIIKGASLAASRLKIDILIHITDRSDHRGWLDSSLLDPLYIHGIIFADIDNDLSVVKKTINHRIPCLVLNNMLREPINCIAVDNKKIAVDIVDYLVELGHAKIATIAGDLTTQAGQWRLDGFKEAMEKHDLKIPKDYIVQGDFLRTPARKAAEKLLKLKDRPTAIFAASDVMALEVLDVAKGNALKVPDDLSVIGFDDNPLNKTSSVRLSTVAQPLIEMGRLGVENLHQISLGKARLPVKIVLPTKLIKRQSTKAVQANH